MGGKSDYKKIMILCAVLAVGIIVIKYRIVQDRLFQSDFDRFIGALPLEEDNNNDN